MPAIRNDFPARVTFPDGEIVQSARAYWRDGWLVVWKRYAADGRVVPVIQETSEAPVNVGRGWTVTNDKGTYTVELLGSCGCGDPMKRFPADAEFERLVGVSA